MNATTTKVTIWGPNLPGANCTFHVHTPGCADTKRGVYRMADQPWTIAVESRQDLAIELWGDIAADTYEADTPEWLALCVEYLDSDVKVFPCVGTLPEVSA